MIQFFKRKVDNSEQATSYRDKLILALNHYRVTLLIAGYTDVVSKRYELILLYIDFQYQFHKEAELNEKTVVKISQGFFAHLKRLNKPVDYLEDHKKIVGDFFTFIVENYGGKTAEAAV